MKRFVLFLVMLTLSSLPSIAVGQECPPTVTTTPNQFQLEYVDLVEQDAQMAYMMADMQISFAKNRYENQVVALATLSQALADAKCNLSAEDYDLAVGLLEEATADLLISQDCLTIMLARIDDAENEGGLAEDAYGVEDYETAYALFTSSLGSSEAVWNTTSVVDDCANSVETRMGQVALMLIFITEPPPPLPPICP